MGILASAIDAAPASTRSPRGPLPWMHGRDRSVMASAVDEPGATGSARRPAGLPC